MANRRIVMNQSDLTETTRFQTTHHLDHFVASGPRTSSSSNPGASMFVIIRPLFSYSFIRQLFKYNQIQYSWILVETVT